MRNASRFRPSPALVISFIALSVSISGVAWAAATIGTSDIKNGAVTKKKLHKNAVTTNKIKNDAVTGAKAKESSFGQVPNANHADNANHANTADNANKADRATDANTIAYGMFEADGTTSAANRVKNLSNANVTNPAAGTYCFDGLSFTPLSAMVTGDSGFGFIDTLASVRIATPTGGALAPCPATAPVRVLTFDISSATLINRRFLIWFQD